MALTYLADGGAVFVMTGDAVPEADLWAWYWPEEVWKPVSPAVAEDVIDSLHAGDYVLTDSPPEGVPPYALPEEETP